MRSSFHYFMLDFRRRLGYTGSVVLAFLAPIFVRGGGVYWWPSAFWTGEWSIVPLELLLRSISAAGVCFGLYQYYKRHKELDKEIKRRRLGKPLSRPKDPTLSGKVTPLQVENTLEGLVQKGFVYTYKEQYGEQTHVFTKGETEVEIFADAKAFYCMVKTKEFPLTEISKSPLATPLWKKEYKAAPPEKRLLLIRDLLVDGLVALQDLLK